MFTTVLFTISIIFFLATAYNIVAIMRVGMFPSKVTLKQRVSFLGLCTIIFTILTFLVSLF